MVEPIQKVGLLLGGKVTCAPNSDTKSLPNKGIGHSKIHESLGIPPSDVTQSAFITI